jgi:hypothetical protein
MFNGTHKVLSSTAALLGLFVATSCGPDTGSDTGSEHTETQSAAVLVETYSQQAYIKASNSGQSDRFASSALSADGNTLVVGAPWEDSNATGINGNQSNNSAVESGAVYVFNRSGSWSSPIYIKASNTGGGNGFSVPSGDLFGCSVAISGDGNTIAVGAPGEDSAATGVNGSQSNNSKYSSGAVYVFVRSGSTWSQQAYVKASNTGGGSEVAPHAWGDLFGSSVALSSDGNTLAVGAPLEDSSAVNIGNSQSSNSAPDSGAVYVYTRSGTTWSGTPTYVKASNTDADDRFGTSVVLSGDGNTLAVAATGEDGNGTALIGNDADDSSTSSGAVYVYTRSGGTWSVPPTYVKASNTQSGDGFGSSIGLSADGSTLAVGAHGEDSGTTGVNGGYSESAPGSGAAYVYTKSAGQWSWQTFVKASNTEAGDVFGTSLALSGDGAHLVVGAAGEDSSSKGVDGSQNNLASSSGAAYGYVFSGGTWTHTSYLKASNTAADDGFASVVANGGAISPGVISLSSDGGTLAIAAPGEDSNADGVGANQLDNTASASGAVYVFTSGVKDEFAQTAFVKATNTDSNDALGNTLAVSADGNTLLVGAPGEDSNAINVDTGSQASNTATDSGAAYVYVRSGNSWAPQEYLKSSNTDAGDAFGYAVAISTDGNTVAIGAPGEDSANGIITDNTASGSGAVYVLTRSGSLWTPQAYLKAPTIDAGDGFGTALALSGDGNTLVVTAPSEDSSAVNVNGSQTNNSKSNSGAAYVYTRAGSSWNSSPTYLKPFNTDSGDNFGASVAVSTDGNTIAIGATEEDSPSILIGPITGDSSNTHSATGAVYVFARPSGTWIPQAYVKAANTGVGDRFGSSVALSSDGNTLAAGARGESSTALDANGEMNDDSSPFSGAAYVYTRSSSWGFEAYLKASNTAANALFGWSVAMSANGNTLAVGAIGESSSATGVGGSMDNEWAPVSGAAYTFSRSGNQWTRGDYIKASNTGEDDQFGRSVSLSADAAILAVGANAEDSSCLGVDCISDEAASDSGAAYVYSR